VALNSSSPERSKAEETTGSDSNRTEPEHHHPAGRGAFQP
jgi:hypothetical protein